MGVRVGNVCVCLCMRVCVCVCVCVCAGHMANLSTFINLVGMSAWFNPVTGASVEANNEAIHALTGIPQVCAYAPCGCITPILTLGIVSMAAATYVQ